MDLFTSAERTDFRDGVTTIKSAYQRNGLTVRVDVGRDHFARWSSGVWAGMVGYTLANRLADAGAAHSGVTLCD